MKLTFGTVKAACAKILNVNSSDGRVLDYVNRAQERLLYEGKWIETTVRYTVCVIDGCITWPREIETIEAYSICRGAGVVRNQFYEFLGFGPGQMRSGRGCSRDLVDRGNAVAFDDVIGTGKKLAIWSDASETAGLKVLVRYYDGNANKVFTTIGGVVAEGEEITISPGGYALSASECMAGGLYEVIKPVTKLALHLWEYDVGAATYRALAIYEPDETLPTYRRSLIPGLAARTGGTCTTQRVTVLAKRRFIAIGDNSVLMISHADAVRLACQAVKKEEDLGPVEAAPFWQMAYRCLERQLRHYQGDGMAAPINFVGVDSPVCHVI